MFHLINLPDSLFSSFDQTIVGSILAQYTYNVCYGRKKCDIMSDSSVVSRDRYKDGIQRVLLSCVLLISSITSLSFCQFRSFTSWLTLSMSGFDPSLLPFSLHYCIPSHSTIRNGARSSCVPSTFTATICRVAGRSTILVLCRTRFSVNR